MLRSIVDHIACVEEEMSIQNECKIEGFDAFLYKIAFCLIREDSKVKFAMTACGGTFNAAILDRFEEVKEPIYEDQEHITTIGFFWRQTHRTTRKVQIGEKVTKTPKFKGMSHDDLQTCMSMLEARACEKVLETIEHAQLAVQQQEAPRPEHLGQLSQRRHWLKPLAFVAVVAMWPGRFRVWNFAVNLIYNASPVAAQSPSPVAARSLAWLLGCPWI